MESSGAGSGSDTSPKRATLHITKLQGMIRWGDIILFKCVNSLSSLQRKITGSNWDHVGIVVSKGQVTSARVNATATGSVPYYNNYNLSELYLLESTVQGVTVFPLIPRLNAYHNTKVCIIIICIATLLNAT